LAGYRELIPFGLPRFQFTARMVPQGGIRLAFSAGNGSPYVLLFADRLLEHFCRCGVAALPVVATEPGWLPRPGGIFSGWNTPAQPERLVAASRSARR
jgi:hypothetical protein